MYLPLVIVGEDTVPTCSLQEIIVISKLSFKDPYDEFRFNQLKRNVMVVYPYAKEAGRIFDEINAELTAAEKRKDQKKYLKQKEDQLDALFKDQLKNLTTTQGEILVKLISREIGISVYDLIKEFKNSTSAFTWNKMSQLYGYSLKRNYDPKEEMDIEIIVRSLEGVY